MYVQCKTRYGQMLVNDRDAFVGRSLMAYGEFSQGEAQLFTDLIRPGAVVVDVGANIGAHTLLFSRLVGPTGRVLAFEPQRLVFQLLCANVALNGIENVYCSQTAIGAEEGTVTLATADPNKEQNFGGLSLTALAAEQGEKVAVRPLDADCNFLKIDVEGMETEVLEGARTAIQRSRPFLYVENDRVENSPRLLQTIESLGYVPYWHLTPLYSPNNFNRVAKNVWGVDFVSFNLLCIPEGVNVKHNLDRAAEDSEAYARRKSGADR